MTVNLKAKISSFRKDLASDDAYIRYLAMEDLGKSDPAIVKRMLPDLIEVLSDDDRYIVASSVRAIAKLGSDAKPALSGMMDLLRSFPDGNSFNLFSRRYIRTSQDIYMSSTRVLAAIGEPAVGPIVEFLNSEELNDVGASYAMLALYAMKRDGVDISPAIESLRVYVNGPQVKSTTQMSNLALRGFADFIVE